MVFIVAIIFVLAGFLTTISYLNNRDGMITQNQALREYGERNALESVHLVDTGLKLYDNTLNNQMKDAFPLFLEAYNGSEADIAGINLVDLKTRLQPGFRGNLDLYIINDTGVIVGSTVPGVMGLDFKQFPEYYRAITVLREGDSFGADRVVRSIQNASERTVTGTLRKFAYMPIPDHRYLLEMGLESNAFFTERTDLSYAGIARRLKELNPNLVSVRIVDINHVLVSDSVNTTEVDDPAINRALTDRESFTVSDPRAGTSISYLFADLRDPEAASDMSLVIELVYSDALLESSLQRLLFVHIVVAVLAVLMGFVLAYGTARFLTRPIEDIMKDVGTIAEGNLDHPIRELDIPEFAQLKESITTMIRQIRQFSEELERGRAELEIAAEIQKSFMPEVIPKIAGFDIAARTVMAKEVGGDFFDVFPYEIFSLDKGTLGLLIADVSGKGVPAALFMALSRIVVRVNALWHRNPAKAIYDANNTITQESKSGMFVTLFFGKLSEVDRTLTYVNAGHNPPVVFRNRDDTLEELLPTGIVLGAVENREYASRTLSICPGDVIVMYTDGVTESINEKEELFGEERLNSIIRKNARLSAQEILDRILSGVQEFAGDMPQFDDITLLVIKGT